MAGTSKSDPGQPGGGKGRIDEVKGSPVYPGSGPLPGGEAAVRTPGSFVHGQLDEQGRPVEGGSEMTMTESGVVLGGATPPSSSPPQGRVVPRVRGVDSTRSESRGDSAWANWTPNGSGRRIQGDALGLSCLPPSGSRGQFLSFPSSHPRILSSAPSIPPVPGLTSRRSPMKMHSWGGCQRDLARTSSTTSCAALTTIDSMSSASGAG
jgi:hypothetical protein